MASLSETLWLSCKPAFLYLLTAERSLVTGSVLQKLRMFCGSGFGFGIDD